MIQSASDSVEQVFGWTPAELCGRNVKVLVPEPRRSALDRYLDRYRDPGKTRALQRSRRFEAVRKDGTNIQIDLSMSRAELPLHGTPYFIGIVRDVSRQIDTAADSAEEQTRLQLLITEQTRALATANLRLQLTDRLASLGTLAAGLGHDMNNVLLPVRARLDAIEHAGVTPAARVHITAVRRSLAYLQHLSDGLHFLVLDPGVAGTIVRGHGSTDISHWWDQVGVLLQTVVPKHVTVTASFPSKLPLIRVAPHWLTQALLNLIVNAGESIPRGRRSGKVRITGKVVEDGSLVQITVTDNGRGMSPSTRKRAWDLFFTTKARGMGTGLGLPLVRRVALKAGGTVDLKSAVGSGTSVMLRLPVASGEGDAKGGESGVTAAVSIGDHRVAALVFQILAAQGAHVSHGTERDPVWADVLVVDPTLANFAKAVEWRRTCPDGVLVALGPPPIRLRARWSTVGSVVVDPAYSFEAIRQALCEAFDKVRSGHIGGKGS